MNKIFDLLTICENEFIGSYKDPSIKYSSDIDIQEYIANNLDFDEKTFKILMNYIYKYFLNIFEIAYKTKSFYITDFKCGEYKTQKLRWSYTDMKNGYKIIEDIKPVRIYFTNALQSKSIIKIDILYIENKTNIIKEITKNYYFVFNNYDTTKQTENIYKSLMLDVKKYSKIDYIKSVKRLYKYNKLLNKPVNHLLKIINSNVGRYDYYLNQLELIEKFKSIKPLPSNYSKIINDNIQYINNGLSTNLSFKELTILREEFKKKILSLLK